jgi:predicted lipoprotein with Yx(FWY)xxD motif
MTRRISTLAGLAATVALLAACGGAGSTTAPTVGTTTTTTTEAATTTAATTSAETTSAETTTVAGGATVNAHAVGSAGTILVAGSNDMTLYNFTKDTKDSGTSACTGGCLDTWPALTVAAGETPVAGEGVTGKLGTITRSDDGSIQVTYNGLPLYFFKNDKAPGDLNGVYESWVTVKP